ncbi:outer membrane beta-barrel protein [Spirosoma aerolatum]|uniref:outer membrane beta-barrel protein n=1 Tax=Spirosoma aerolatum TaxID=1211326 RepID=UPI0009ABC3F6|nr:outer membrane beta-barrel family protein [Spirosoma aerolatum]
MKSFSLLVLFISLTTHLRAQTGATKSEIRGIVIDSVSGKPLRQASVALLSARDSSYITATITDGDGLFELRTMAKGSYRLLITFLGYRNLSRPFTITSEKPVLNLGILRMIEQSNQLQEVVIRQESTPIAVKGDTLEFNAGSFKTQPNAQVEELLRKLPGMEVSRDGNIKAQGQAVSRVLVDGKPFFGNDPKMATRNLPADIVDKVQLYDQSSDQSQFSGIDDGNRERTINLTLKRDKRKGYFGQNSLGLGTARDGQDNRYQARLNLNRFNNGRQLSLIGQANNLNQQNFTLADPSASGPVFVGSPGSTPSGNPQTPTNVVEVRAGGLNYRDKWGQHAEIATSYFLNQAITTSNQQSYRTSVLPENSLITDQSSSSQNRQLMHRYSARLDWQLDSLTSLRLTPNLSWQTSDYSSQNNSQSTLPGLPGSTPKLVNKGETSYGSDGNSLNLYNNLLLMRKFHREGRTLSLNLNTTLGDGDTQAINQTTNTFYDSTGTNPLTNRLNQQNCQTSYGLQNTLTLSYTEPLSLTQKLEFKYIYSLSSNQADRHVADLNESTGLYDRTNSLLSNAFTSAFATHRAGATLQTRRLRYTYSLGLEVQQSLLQTNNRSVDTIQRRTYLNLLPNALFNYTFSGNRNLRIQYRTRLNAPSITQLQPIIDNTNPLNIRIGNTALAPEFYNSLTLTYNGSSGQGNKSLFVFASLNQSNNRIATATAISNAGIQTTQPINTGGYWSATGVFSLGRTLQPSKIGLTLTTNASFSRAISFINDLSNESKTSSIGQGVRLQSNFNNSLEYGVSGNLAYQTASYSLLPKQNTTFWSQYATADLYWKLPFRLVLTSDVTYTATTGRAAGYNQQFVLWNAALARQFFKGNTGELRIQVFDLLNQNRSLTRNTTDTYIEDVQSRILRRYLLVSFVYNLRKFGI